MRDLGVNVVRVFATWMSFVESETRVNEEGFDKFDSMLRIAWENGILLHPTGPDHWEGQPAFMRGDANYITVSYTHLDVYKRQHVESVARMQRVDF